MQHSPSVPWRALKAAFGLGAAAVASLAFAGAASASVQVITGDNNTGSDHLTAAISASNANCPATGNTIVLSPGVYQPKTQPITISCNLTIVGDHSYQSVNSQSQIEVNGSTANAAAFNNLFVIPHGVNVTMESFQLDGAGQSGFSSVLDNGNLTWWGMETNGSLGQTLQITGIGTATLNDSDISANIQAGITLQAGGSLTMNNTTMDSSGADGIDITGTPYTLNMTNSVMAFQTGIECNGGTATNGGPGSLDDDGSCGVQYSDDTTVDSYSWNEDTHGGPTTTYQLPAGNPDTTGRGVNCPTTDQRFFVNPVVNGKITCDIGSVTNGATQETAPPACTVTGGTTGPPKTQTVALQDTLSGVGPQPGPATDNPSNTPATAYPPPAAVPLPGYPVDNLQINNGTVGFTPFTAPATSQLVLTATKTNQSATTQWSFTGQNWAGISKNCY